MLLDVMLLIWKRNFGEPWFLYLQCFTGIACKSNFKVLPSFIIKLLEAFCSSFFILIIFKHEWASRPVLLCWINFYYGFALNPAWYITVTVILEFNLAFKFSNCLLFTVYAAFHNECFKYLYNTFVLVKGPIDIIFSLSKQILVFHVTPLPQRGFSQEKCNIVLKMKINLSLLNW